jgi:hypothetical protein
MITLVRKRDLIAYWQRCGRYWVAVLLVAIGIVGAGAVGTAQAAMPSLSNVSGTRFPALGDQCSSAHLSVSQDREVSAPTQNDMLLVVLTSRVGASCWLDGYPRIAFRDKLGRSLPFEYRHGGNVQLWVTRRSPAVVHLTPVAYLLIDKAPCLGSSDQAVSLAIIPPGNTKPIPLAWSEPFLSYCGQDDPGHVVAVSPIESSQDAVYGPT